MKREIAEITYLRKSCSGKVEMIPQLLSLIGVSYKSVGYFYLKDALFYFLDIPKCKLAGILASNALYSKIAGYYGITPEFVEHAIEAAIEKCITESNSIVFEKIFNRYPINVSRISNKDFIYTLVCILEDF